MGRISFNGASESQPIQVQSSIIKEVPIIVEKEVIKEVIVEKEIPISPNLEDDFHELYLKIINELKTIQEETNEQHELDLNDVRLELQQQIYQNNEALDQMKKTYKSNIQILRDEIKEEIELVDELQKQLGRNILEIHEKYDNKLKVYNKIMVGVVLLSIALHFIF